MLPAGKMISQNRSSKTFHLEPPHGLKKTLFKGRRILLERTGHTGRKSSRMDPDIGWPVFSNSLSQYLKALEENPGSRELYPDQPNPPLTRPNVPLPKEGASRPDPASFKELIHQKAGQAALNQKEPISHQSADPPLRLQSPQAAMIKEQSASPHHSFTTDTGTTDTGTTDTGNSASRIKKVFSPEHFRQVEHAGPFMNNDNSGSPLPTLRIPFSAEGILQSAVSHLSAHLKNHGHNLTIDLYPEYLGKLHINLEVKENNLRVHIMAENPLAQKILEENLSMLKASLANQGVHVEYLSVSIGGNDQNQPGEQTLKRQPQQGGQEIRDVSPSSDGKLPAAQEQMDTHHEYNGTNYLA